MARFGWLVSLALMVVACDQRAEGPAPSTTQAPASTLRDAHIDAAENECFMAAAENFEGLTEKSADASVPDLAHRIASASTQARACQLSLSTQQAWTLNNVTGRIGQFETTHDRSALALAAVEGYRLFVTAESRPVGGIPLEVSLLDYAGFRYQADARTPRPLWSDMAQALDVADRQWANVASRVRDQHTSETFAARLNAMHEALRALDKTRAESAASQELDEVDVLENYFTHASH